MAKKEFKEKKIVLERTYVVPLRKEYRKAPNWKRTPRAVRALRDFVFRHMKAKEVKIGKFLNQKMWERGIKNPIHKVKVECKKDEDGVVTAELFGAPKEKPREKKAKREKEMKTPPKEKEEDKALEISVKEALGEEKEKKVEESREIEKEELKELKKEHPKAHAPKQEAVPQKMVRHTTGGPQQKG